MRPSTRREHVAGPAGLIECAVDSPEGAPRGGALIAHPHPLFGGTLDNKVVQTLARAFLALGYETWRPNFRGVGASAGVHDEGRGEVDDLLAVFRQRDFSVLAGFSFGGAMAALAAARVEVERLVLVAPSIVKHQVPPVAAGTLLIHGELDDTVPLAAVLDWARPQDLPVVLAPGADHFFNRRLQILRDIVQSYCR